MAVSTRILIADWPTLWRDRLVEALQKVERAVRITESGTELRRALEETSSPPKLVVIGSGLEGIGPLEALFQAERTLMLERKPRPKWPQRSVSLITDVRSDAELLDLFRRRGVTHFIYREDPVERTVESLLANLKPASRALVRLDAEIKVKDDVVAATVYDISRSGAQVIVSMDDTRAMVPVGSEVQINIRFRKNALSCNAEVRRLSTKKASQGERLVFGLHFLELEDAQTQALEAMIIEASDEYEMLGSGL